MDDGGEDPFTTTGTVGIEEEFFLVDEAGRPVAGTDELCYERDPPAILEDRLGHELFTFIIETQTPVIDDLGSAPAVLEEVRTALVEYAHEHGYHVAAAGLHPTARWREHDHATKPRYRRQLERIKYPQHRNTTAGLHVHVGVDDAERAMWVANELRWYLPVLLALSANSPFWNGFDTGLASARAKVFEGLPNTGMPSAFTDYEAYRSFERLMLETDGIRDRGEIWFDVRPHTEYGTVEVRSPDAQWDASVVLALTEYVHRLVERLARAHRQAGRGAAETIADAHAPWARPTEDGPIGGQLEVLRENKWRALRYGWEASFLRRDGSGTVDLAGAAADERDRLDLSRLGDLLERGPAYRRLRSIRSTEGVDALRRAIAVERP